MASATETSILVREDSSGGTSCKRSMGRRLFLVTLIILVAFQLGGVPAVIVYFLRTCYCAMYEKLPHYNCEESPEIIGLGQYGAMILELTFACSQVVSRAIFLCFAFKLLLKRGPIWREFLKPLCKLPQTWPFLGTSFLCVARLVLILIDMGEEFKIAKTTNAMYVIDAFAMTTVVIILNFVKLRVLAEDNVSTNQLCRVCGIRVTKKGFVFFLFKCVLASFWFQHFLYFTVVLIQLTYNVSEVGKEFLGEHALKAINLLKDIGQSTFMALICAFLWLKLFDDNKCILGTKTDEVRQTPERSQSSISYDSMSGSDQYQSCFEELTLSSSSEYFTASASSTDM